MTSLLIRPPAWPLKSISITNALISFQFTPRSASPKSGTEVRHFDGAQLRIHRLKQDAYIQVPTSQALPMLTDHFLTDLLTRLREEGEFQTLLAFDEWLQIQAGLGAGSSTSFN